MDKARGPARLTNHAILIAVGWLETTVADQVCVNHGVEQLDIYGVVHVRISTCPPRAVSLAPRAPISFLSQARLFSIKGFVWITH